MTDWIYAFLDVPRDAWEVSKEFWTRATGWGLSAPRGEAGQFVTLEPAAGDAWVKMQAVDGPPGIHLDLDSPDRGAAVDRSVALGARKAWVYDEVQVMTSPGGLVFCHTLSDGPRRIERHGLRCVLDQICIDIPSSHWEAEIAFWQAITGREPDPRPRPEFAALTDPDPAGGLRILLQRLDETDGAVRAHADFATADRRAETDRHVALGATVRSVHDGWTVLSAPDGHPYCLTDRNPATGRR